ncbi:sortase B [Breznakia blatticola]|uniref:Sortase B n=1 Tax=Breznakia blatticola TaxID=1754012 RepID=A0A4R7ZV00_9FIRM|nr:class B sortase [Breznakia blatticola]TDW20628.1 sortase B [Breznakia blatticola]
MKDVNKKEAFIDDKKERQIKIIRGFSTIVDYVVMFIFLLLMIFGCYSIWDNNQVVGEAGATHYEAYKPTSEDTTSFEELQEINDEVIAWLNVYGTQVDYPVTQAKDNSKYLNINAKGDFSLAGSLYLDYNNNPDFSDFNSIIYGHHVEKNAMFGNLDKFQDKKVFDTYKYGNLFVRGKDYGIEFFAYVEADAYDLRLYNPDIKDKKQQEEYLSYLLSISTYSRDIKVSTSDRILLLSTCASDATNGRYILVGRLGDEIFKDSFSDNKISEMNNDSSFSNSSLFGISIFVILILLLLLLLLLYLWLRRKRRNDQEEAERIEDAEGNKKMD